MEFGVNLNNREPLITSDYTLADLLDLAELAEQRGFGSVCSGCRWTRCGSSCRSSAAASAASPTRRWSR